jgi:hypothetical protein
MLRTDQGHADTIGPYLIAPEQGISFFAFGLVPYFKELLK